MSNIIEIDDCMVVTREVAACLATHFPIAKVYVVNDVEGEDHVYAQDASGKPMFDMLISNSRKFVFLWYYLAPKKGIEMVTQMKDISIRNKKDFVIKFPNVPVKKPVSAASKVPNKDLYPTIMRFGKKPAGETIEKFMVKAGNPNLEEKIYTQGVLADFRTYDWHLIPGALDKILERSKEMVAERLKRNPDKLKNIRGYFLYAGCAYSFVYPELGFGMRDIDVEVLFSPEWFTNTRCAFTRYCNIEEFGKPEYFNKNTRWLDLMWNSLHTESGVLKEDLLTYMAEMRFKSDRWATMSQRPFIDLETKEIVYEPNWIKKIKHKLNK